jgi:hypothetical protein
MAFGITEETSMPIPCGIVQSANTLLGDVLADAETLLAARLQRISLDDIARQAQPNLHLLQLGAHHHG